MLNSHYSRTYMHIYNWIIDERTLSGIGVKRAGRIFHLYFPTIDDVNRKSYMYSGMYVWMYDVWCMRYIPLSHERNGFGFLYSLIRQHFTFSTSCRVTWRAFFINIAQLICHLLCTRAATRAYIYHCYNSPTGTVTCCAIPTLFQKFRFW